MSCKWVNFLVLNLYEPLGMQCHLKCLMCYTTQPFLFAFLFNRVLYSFFFKYVFNHQSLKYFQCCHICYLVTKIQPVFICQSVFMAGIHSKELKNLFTLWKSIVICNFLHALLQKFIFLILFLLNMSKLGVFCSADHMSFHHQTSVLSLCHNKAFWLSWNVLILCQHVLHRHIFAFFKDKRQTIWCKHF